MDQPLADFRSGNQHGKVIQERAGAKYKLLEKRMKTQSSLVIDQLTSISNCYYRREIHKEGCQLSPRRQKLLVLSHVSQSQSRSLHLVHLHKPEFSGLLG